MLCKVCIFESGKEISEVDNKVMEVTLFFFEKRIKK